MFFNRFEEDKPVVSSSDRLAALKQKIAEKQRLAEKQKELENEAKLKIKHPEKRRKVSSEGEAMKKKKKKRAESCETAELISEYKEEQEPEEKPKKRKKKKKEEQEVVPDIELSVKLKKKKKKRKAAEPELENGSPAPETEIVPTEEAEEEAKPEEEEAKPEEKEEEWTILGKHKTTEKVGHVKRDLPEWIVNCEVIDPDFNNTTDIEQFLQLDRPIIDILKKMDIKSLFPIQSQIIPEILQGCDKVTMLSPLSTPPSDICVSAPTGSGKTLVYVLSLVQSLYTYAPMMQAIVVVPTKNLAKQVKQVFNNFNQLIKVALLSGKDTFPAEQKHLYSDNGSCLVHVAVATPGRLVNHLRDTKLFTLKHLRFLVIDEMDTLLTQTYQDWLPQIFKTVYNPNPYEHPMQPRVTPSRYPTTATLTLHALTTLSLPLQKLLFSATLTHDPARLAPLHLHHPVLYSCGGKYRLPQTLLQFQIRCVAENKPIVLIHLVKKLRHVLCFTSAVETAHRLAILTEEFGGIKVAEYSSSLTVQQRNKVMRDFSLGEIQLLVCSDSLARGMDLRLVDQVINYDVPSHVQTYVHRVGRTARAGREGRAYTLVRHEEVRNFHQLLKKAGDTRTTEMKITEEDLEELSENYEAALLRLETRIKSKGKKKD